MNQSSIQIAPPSLCSKAPCTRVATLACPFCNNAPPAPGNNVPSPYCCSEECARSDWPRHRVDCLASRERRALFDAAKEIQREYYAACDMDLNFAVANGERVGTEVRYDPGVLRQRMDLVRRNEQFFNAFRACFGEYNPILQGLDHMASRLRGLNVRVCVVTLRMKRVRGFSFDLLVSSAVDEHKVIKVRTSNGERYALDIAGAKFDLYTTVVPWRQYVDLHAREVLFSEDIFNA